MQWVLDSDGVSEFCRIWARLQAQLDHIITDRIHEFIQYSVRFLISECCAYVHEV